MAVWPAKSATTETTDAAAVPAAHEAAYLLTNPSHIPTHKTAILASDAMPIESADGAALRHAYFLTH